MKNNFKFIFILTGILILGLIFWNVFLLNTNAKLQKEKYEIEENYHALDAYNQILKYDLVTSRDSVRILEKQNNE